MSLERLVVATKEGKEDTPTALDDIPSESASTDPERPAKRAKTTGHSASENLSTALGGRSSDQHAKTSDDRTQILPRKANGEIDRLACILEYMQENNCGLAKYLEVAFDEIGDLGMYVRVKHLDSEAAVDEAFEDCGPVLATIPADAIMSNIDFDGEALFRNNLKSEYLLPQEASSGSSTSSGSRFEKFRETLAWGPAEDLVLYMGLVRFHGMESKYVKYIMSLPPSANSPLEWPEAERQHLLGDSNLGLEVNNILATLETQAAYLEKVTLPELIWARTAFTSRAFPPKLKDGSGATAPLMVPVIDLFNHRHEHPAKVCRDLDGGARASIMDEQRDDGTQQKNIVVAANDQEHELQQPGLLPPVVLMLEEAVEFESGSEVFNNYGNKSNEELLLQYGFTVADNKFDRVHLNLSATFEDKDVYESKLAAARVLLDGDRFAQLVQTVDFPKLSFGPFFLRAYASYEDKVQNSGTLWQYARWCREDGESTKEIEMLGHVIPTQLVDLATIFSQPSDEDLNNDKGLGKKGRQERDLSFALPVLAKLIAEKQTEVEAVDTRRRKDKLAAGCAESRVTLSAQYFAGQKLLLRSAAVWLEDERDELARSPTFSDFV